MNEVTAPQQSESRSLYDSKEEWLSDPANAFLSFLKTSDYTQSTLSTRKLPVGHEIKPQSALVYETMFHKFLNFLEVMQVDFLGAQAKHVDSFMGGALASATKETAWRYVRLLERVYGHLAVRGFISDNPVTTWVKGRIEEGVSPKVGREGAARPVFTRTEAEVLQDWLFTKGTEQLDAGSWRVARDLTLGSLSLGSGMRCAELIALTEGQVKYTPTASRAERFDIDIPHYRTVATSRKHETSADFSCVDLFEKYWHARWKGFPGSTKLDGSRGPSQKVPGQLVFPSGKSGESLSVSTVYKNLKTFARQAVKDGVLSESVVWVLSTGAQGLRRAYAETELENEAGGQLLKTRLGYHDMRSVRRLREKIAKAPGRQS